MVCNGPHWFSTTHPPVKYQLHLDWACNYPVAVDSNELLLSIVVLSVVTASETSTASFADSDSHGTHWHGMVAYTDQRSGDYE